MKNIAILILFLLALTSCDKVSKPSQRPPAVYHCIDSTTQIVMTNTATNVNTRKVLVEEYTGHLCPNCPPAALIMEGIISTYGDRVVPITNHITKQFAKPVTDSTFKEDFRDTTTRQWDENVFHISSSTGLPKGMVNRQAPLLQAPSAWSGLVASNITMPQTAKLEMKSYYNPNNHYFTVDVKATFKSAWPNNVNLMIVLTQDSIVSDQEDSAPPQGAVMDPNNPIRRLNYKFDHIVIGSVNDPYGAYGQLMKKGPIVAGDTASAVNSCFLIEKCFFKSSTKPSVCLNDRNINVVAFVYDVTTFEVLQAEQMKIRP